MISAKVIADSVYNDKRITTLQLVMPRFILSQFNKHRAFSSNAASSRAIPTAKLIEQVCNDCVEPVYWGENRVGMVADRELKGRNLTIAKGLWWDASNEAVKIANLLMQAGAHKQIVNRILEPFMWAHVVVTATEWDNFFKLRLEHDSQPEMQELARCMKEAMDNSKPQVTNIHLPYVTDEERNNFSAMLSYVLEKISEARCARVSYLNHDQSEPILEKDLALADRLLKAKHLTCFEHQACGCPTSTEKHGNFTGWYQFRKALEDDVVW